MNPRLEGLTAQQLRKLSTDAIRAAEQRACTASLVRAGYCAGDAGHPLPHYLVTECTVHGSSNEGGLVTVTWDDTPSQERT